MLETIREDPMILGVIGAGILVNIPIVWGIGHIFWRTPEDFFESLVFWFKPDSWSWWDGDYALDIWHEMKIWLFLTLCALVLYLEYLLLIARFGKV
jgi:hypothetical protein